MNVRADAVVVRQVGSTRVGMRLHSMRAGL